MEQERQRAGEREREGLGERERQIESKGSTQKYLQLKQRSEGEDEGNGAKPNKFAERGVSETKQIPYKAQAIA